METKKCNRCKEEKPLSEFLFRNKERGTYHSACRICYKDIRKKSYNRTKETSYKKNLKNRVKNREWFNDLKSTLKCEVCSENHPATLDFHHIDSTEKENSVANLIGTYSKKRILEEINKCVVLCANCHRKHHYNEDY